MTAIPVVSVVIPVHNREAMIERAIKSVLAQTFQDFEIIVVDDASTDRSIEAARRVGDGRVTVYAHETNKGPSAARNTGTTHARGRYVAYLDSDNEWLPGRLAAQLKVFERSTDENLGSVVCDMLGADGSRTRYVKVRAKGDVYEEALALGGHLDTGVHLLKRECVADIGMWDEQLVASEDRDFAIRLARKYSFDYTGQPGLIVHRHDGPRVSAPVRKIAGRRQIIEKYRVELTRRPRVLARHLFILASLEVRISSWSNARIHVFESVRTWPWSWRRDAIALLGLFGSRGVRMGFRLLSCTSPKP
jgi:glycosyltransferase involved in cell wall biosynthesis